MFRIGLEHEPLRGRLGRGVVTRGRLGVRKRRRPIRLIPAVEDHRRRAREDEFWNPGGEARRDEHFRPDHVRTVVAFIRPPHAGFRRGVESDIATCGRFCQCRKVDDVRTDEPRAQSLKFGVFTPRDHGDLVAAADQKADDRGPEKPAPAGDQSSHRRMLRVCEGETREGGY